MVGDRATGIFTTQAETQKALEALRDDGFKIENVSVMAKDTERSHNKNHEDRENRYCTADSDVA